MTPFPREELRAWFVLLTGLHTKAIVFSDEPEAMTTGPGRLRITITTNDAASIEDIWGDADPVVGQPPIPGAAKVTTRELDYMTLSLVYELQAPATTSFPDEPLRRIRTKSQQLSFLEKLRAIGFCLVDTGPIRSMAAKVSEARSIPYAHMDLRVGFYNEDVVQSPDEMATDFINEAKTQIEVVP